MFSFLVAALMCWVSAADASTLASLPIPSTADLVAPPSALASTLRARRLQTVRRTKCDGDACSVSEEVVVVDDDPSAALFSKSASSSSSAIANELVSALDCLRDACSPAQHVSAAKLLLKYCENAAADPENIKFRKVRVLNAAFQRVLAPYLAEAAGCLEALGFELEDGDSDESVYALRRPNLQLLRRGATLLRAERRASELSSRWPAELRGCLPMMCRRLLDESPELVQEISDELAAPHVPRLLAHADNAKRLEQSLKVGAAPVVRAVALQLREIRKNVTAEAAGADVDHGLVTEIETAEAWYDLMLADENRLIVADFGASWCGPCKALKPLFASLSKRFPDVAFVYLDADKVPTLMGDNMIHSYPTIKFFRCSAEADLPVVGPDITEVEERIKSLL
uniref:Thioredoxin domain-containing protein n=1 Tax=Coccolithus braarudii TaxID=221442 RepID=A0A7S0L2E8_9EUKA|mmetsp:Transcript_16502/g.35766  ORF Transcript_16502/g.35766 Transcript_16502/m.35766 type:complete len:398 (+) Transcript_16502:16-1209(+)